MCGNPAPLLCRLHAEARADFLPDGLAAAGERVAAAAAARVSLFIAVGSDGGRGAVGLFSSRCSAK